MSALHKGRLASRALAFEHLRVLERTFDFPAASDLA